MPQPDMNGIEIQEAADRRARDSMRGAEIKEGILAFSEKRPPKF